MFCHWTRERTTMESWKMAFSLKGTAHVFMNKCFYWVMLSRSGLVRYNYKALLHGEQLQLLNSRHVCFLFLDLAPWSLAVQYFLQKYVKMFKYGLWQLSNNLFGIWETAKPPYLYDEISVSIKAFKGVCSTTYVSTTVLAQPWTTSLEKSQQLIWNGRWGAGPVALFNL